MKKMLVLICGLMIAAAAQAQIIHVPGDYDSIQLGINAATDGDTVLVAEDIYYEQINFKGKAITVASEFLLDGDTSHIGKTIIDGSLISDPDSGSIVYFISGEDTTSILCGFTLRHGNIGTYAAYPTGGSLLSGGAIYIFGSGAKIVYNHITGDTLHATGRKSSGAGISSGQWWEDPSWVVIDHNTIDHNVSTSDVQSFGTGISVTTNSRITNNVISDNTSHATGSGQGAGAAFLAGGETYWASLSAEVRNNVIKNNLAISDNSWGGGASFFQFISAICTGNTYENNMGTTTSSTYSSGAAGFYGPRTGTVCSDNTFKNNSITGYGGAVYVVYDAMNVDSDTVLVERNYFIGNEAKFGGAIYTDNNPIVVQNNVFNSNSATFQGGAIRMQFSQMGVHNAILENNSFAGNKAAQRGGAIYSVNGSLLILNSIFWNDSSDVQYGPEIYVNNSQDTSEIAYSDIDFDKIYGPSLNGGGNIDDDPLFEFTDLLVPFHNSPCIDKGAAGYTCTCGTYYPAPAYDLWEMPRPIGDGYDMGAYEQEYWGVGIKPITNYGLLITNSPNPFANSTTFSYQLSAPGHVTLQIYDGMGSLIAEPVDAWQQQGAQKVQFNATGLPAGLYYYRIQVGEKVGGGKLVHYSE